MRFKNFEDFLKTKHMEDEPTVLDDDLPEAFDQWITELDVESWFKYGDEFLERQNKAVCTKCGNQVKGDTDALCERCV